MSSAETTTDNLLEALESIKLLLDESDNAIADPPQVSTPSLSRPDDESFAYRDAMTIIQAGKRVTARTKDPHQYLVDDLVSAILPNVEKELRAKLHSMSLQELEALLSASQPL